MKARINGHIIAYEDEGKGPTVVLIHGYGLSRVTWRYQIGTLSDSGFRIVAPDLRGFGDSQVSQGEYSISVFADDLVGLLNYLGIGRAVFCGMSMGGYVLFDLLDRYLTRVAGACFAVTQCGGDSVTEKARRTAIAKLFREGSRQSALRSLSPLVFGQTKFGRTKALDVAQRSLKATSSEVLAGVLLAMRDRKDYTARIKRFFPAALVIGAEKDTLVCAEHSKYLALTLPNAVCRILPGSVGHFANMGSF